jgi:large subunit ribosomal protein L21
MYAVIETGGKQYRVVPGQMLKIEKLPEQIGDAVIFDKVMMVVDGEAIEIGKPYLPEVKVTATVANTGRGEKIRIIKMKRRKHHMKTLGHRQYFTEVQIQDIERGRSSHAATKRAEVN